MSMQTSSTVQQTNINRVRVMWLAVALALIAALSYMMIQLGLLGVGGLQLTEGPPAIVYMAAGSYLFGGLLILVRRRWLWIIGAVMNALVILFFVMAYQHRPAVMFSPGGQGRATPARSEFALSHHGRLASLTPPGGLRSTLSW